MYQTDPPLSPRKTLPTMYDLPSENIEDPGVPDQYHLLQPRLLGDSFCPPNYPEDQVFVATDLNLYYDVRHTGWYKPPDWFAAIGVDRLYEKRDLRLSYVVWQEGVNPFVVVELLSPGTEKEDLGQTLRDAEKPPTKWEVYEKCLRIPYYLVFDRYTDNLRAFQLQGAKYVELDLRTPRIWMEEIKLGVGLWQGSYEGIERQWLRWYSSKGDWILTPEERQRQRAERLAAKLRELGVNPDEI